MPLDCLTFNEGEIIEICDVQLLVMRRRKRRQYF